MAYPRAACPNRWVNVVKPSKEEQREDEVKEVRRENLQFKARWRRAEKERDIPKQAAAYFAKESG